MYFNLKRHSQGQSLIEVLVTVVVIAAGVIALIRFQNYLAYDSSITQQRADATSLAIQRIEILRDYNVINTTTGYTAYNDIVTGSGSSTVGNTVYSVAWTVTTNTNPDYKVLDVSVTWTDRRSNSQSVRYITRVGELDPAHSANII